MLYVNSYNDIDFFHISYIAEQNPSSKYLIRLKHKNDSDKSYVIKSNTL